MNWSEWLPLVGLGVLGFGYLVYSFRKGGREARAEDAAEDERRKKQHEEVMELAHEQIDFLRQKQARLETLLAECNETAGRMQQIEQEAETLRKLVMGEKVPQAMADALTKVSTEGVGKVVDGFQRVEKNILAAILALGTDIREGRELNSGE